MNLLYLSASGGGLDTNVRVLAPALIQAGHRVSLLYLHFPGDKFTSTDNPLDGGAVYHATIGSWHYYASRATLGFTSLPLIVRVFEYARALGRMIAEIDSREQLDLVELPEVFITARQMHGIPYVMRLHSAAWTWRKLAREPEPMSDRIDIWLEGLALRQARGVSSPCRFTAEYISRMCHVEQPIEIIPYPIDTCQFKPGGERAHPPVIFFVGRVEKRKGAEVLLRAIPRVLQKFPECEFVFAGRISAEVQDSLTRFSREGAGAGRVKLLGARSREELIEWYQRASIFVAPSLWDNSPNTIYEAMACGTPVVATRVGGIPELVDDGMTGLLVPPRDENALADAICTLLGDPARRERMGQCAREKAVANYSVEKIGEETQEFYRRVLSV